MPQHFRDHLGVDVLREQQGGARVPQIMEAEMRQPRALEERFEPTRGEVAAVEGDRANAGPLLTTGPGLCSFLDMDFREHPF